MTEDDVRRIVREEFERIAAAESAAIDAAHGLLDRAVWPDPYTLTYVASHVPD